MNHQGQRENIVMGKKMMSKDRGIGHSVREKMIKHNGKGSHDKKSVILT